jgi:hypothetical protein
MANFNNEHWVPEINKNNLDRTYMYPVYIYENINQDLINLLYETKYLTSDILPENMYEEDLRKTDNTKYIKVETMYNDGPIVLHINKDNEDEFNFIKSENQDLKIIELTIHDKELRKIYYPVIAYDKTNVYINPRDIHILSMYNIDKIKSFIISASTDKVIENRSRRRK